MALVDRSWMPHCAMKRVICHWTAGQSCASALDREHYHILVEADGGLVRGTHSIEDNLLITENGCENLTDLVKDPEELEKIVSGSA